MNIQEYQAKAILAEFGGPVPTGAAQDKIEAMKASGIRVADSPAALGTTLVEALGG